MTILFLDQFSDLGGAQQCLLDLLPAVHEKGWHTVVAAPGDGALLERARQLGAVTVPLRPVRLTAGRKSAADVVRFARATIEWRATIGQIVSEYTPGLIYVNAPRMLPAVRRGAPVLFHVHSDLSKWYAAAAVNHAIRRTGAAVIASCASVAAPLRAKAQVIYNGVRDLGFAPNAAGDVGVVGRVGPEKGQHVFVGAARQVKGPRFVVIGDALFGDAESAAYRDRIRTPEVEFTGWSADIVEAMRRLSVVVVPSTGPEATTRVIPEAWSAGVLVIASRVGGIAEIVEDGVNGFLAEPGSAEDLARLIRHAVGMSTAERGAMLAAGRRRYEERFTLERYRSDVIGAIARSAQIR